MSLKILLLRRKSCVYSNLVEKRLKEKFASVLVISSSHLGEAFVYHHLVEEFQPDLLISFRSYLIIPSEVLERVPKAVNFHPGPPDLRGSGAMNLALYEERERFAITVHEIRQDLDAGRILFTKWFDINKKMSVGELQEKTVGHLFDAFLELETRLLVTGLSFSFCGESWSGNLHRFRDIDHLSEIKPCDSFSTVEKKIKAFHTERFPVYTYVKGRRFIYHPEESF